MKRQIFAVVSLLLLLTITVSAAVRVKVTPASVTLNTSVTQQFTASVSGTRNKTVTWSATCGTVTSGGLYTAPTTENTCSVKASHASGAFGIAIVTVVVPPPDPPPPPPPTTERGPQAVDCPVGAVHITPSQTPQTVINGQAAGTTFCFDAGVWREQTITARAGDQFYGAPGATLNGAKVLSSFTQSGALWYASGQTQENGTAGDGQCLAEAPRCNYTEDIYWDGKPLRQAGSQSAVTPTTFYFDHAADRIYVGADPSGHVVETSTAAFAFTGNVNGVRVENISVINYASAAQQGALGAVGTDWVVRNNLFKHNHGMGARVNTRMQLVNNIIVENGQLGTGGGGTDVLAENNEIGLNNYAGFSWEWEAGGAKWALTTGLIVRNNWSHDNAGPGLWTDIDNYSVTYEGNLSERNVAGIIHEISFSAVIKGNTLKNNGVWSDAAGWYASGWGILISASDGAEVVGNVLECNAVGILGMQQERPGAPGGGNYLLKNMNAHDNSATMCGAGRAAGIVRDNTTGSTTAVFTSQGNTFQGNVYSLTASYPFAWQNGERTLSEWQAYGLQ